MATMSSDCELCRCECPSSSSRTAAAASTLGESHRRSWTCRGVRQSARFAPTTGDRTIPRRRVAPPCARSCLAGGGTASTVDSSMRRPRSWCSCMHVENRLHDGRCLSAIAEPCGLLRLDDLTKNDCCHVATLDSRRRRKFTSTSRCSLAT